MKRDVYVQALKGKITIRHNPFLGIMSVTYREQRLKKKDFDYSYEAVTARGDRVSVALRRKMVGLDAPELFVDGEKIPYLKALRIHEKIIVFLPWLLLFYGAIGGFFAGVTSLAVLTNMRSTEQPINRSIYGIIIGIISLILTIYISNFLS